MSSNRKPGTTVRTTLGALALLGTTALAGAAAGTIVHVTPAAAAAVTRSPAQVACEDFYTWQQHETVANLTAVIHSAAELSKSYLKADLLELAADAASPAASAPRYLSVAIQYAAEDCTGGYGS